jgi:hypothetical protein
LILQQSALTNNKEATKEYTVEIAKVIVKGVSLMCMGVQQKSSKKVTSSFKHLIFQEVSRIWKTWRTSSIEGNETAS